MSGTTILTEEVEVISTDGLSSSELAKLFLIPPSRWSEDGVFAWMQHVCDQFDLDTSTLKNLHINGKELQMLSQTEFEKRIPFGNILWAHLQFLITCRTSDNPELTKYGMVNKAVIPSIKRRCNEPHNSAGNCYYLYEFLLALLQDPLTCPHLIRWLDIKLGVFKLMKTKVVSWMWGQHKKKPEMSYETLGRSLRYYSQKGILRKIIGYHLTYQFRFLPKNLKVVPSLEKCSEEQEIQGARDEWPPCLSSRLKAVALNEVFPLSVGTPNLALLYKTVTTANASQNTRHETTQDIRQKVIHVFKLSPQGVVSEVQLTPEPQISRPVKILRLSNDVLPQPKLPERSTPNESPGVLQSRSILPKDKFVSFSRVPVKCTSSESAKYLFARSGSGSVMYNQAELKNSKCSVSVKYSGNDQVFVDEAKNRKVQTAPTWVPEKLSLIDHWRLLSEQPIDLSKSNTFVQSDREIPSFPEPNTQGVTPRSNPTEGLLNLEIDQNDYEQSINVEDNATNVSTLPEHQCSTNHIPDIDIETATNTVPHLKRKLANYNRSENNSKSDFYTVVELTYGDST